MKSTNGRQFLGAGLRCWRARLSATLHKPWGGWACALGLMAAALVPMGCLSSGDLSTGSDPFPQRAMPLDIGDVLQVTFPGGTNLNTTASIRSDGNVTLPLVGKYHAQGKTLAQAQTDITKLYGSQLQFKEVVVSLASTESVAYVGGAVLKPGKIKLDRPTTLLEAIMAAGGFDEGRANKKRVVVIRHADGGRRRVVVNLESTLQGKQLHPFYLWPYDVVYVPEKVQVF